jgi:hypothetical protein
MVNLIGDCSKWKAQQETLKQAELNQERVDRQARIDAILAVGNASKAKADATEAARLGLTPEGYAFLIAVVARVAELEGQKASGSLAMDEFGRAHSANALMDRARMPHGAALAMADGQGVDLRDRRSSL